jgi:hypothetical protein
MRTPHWKGPAAALAVALAPTYAETPGAHTWHVWRRYLGEFAPRLFPEP